MIRPLRPLDVARYSLLGGPGQGNRVYTLDTVGREPRPRLSTREAAGSSFSLHRKVVCSFARTDRGKVTGVAAASPRSGPRTWAVTHLLLKSLDDVETGALLTELYKGVARRGGERVFVRLRAGDGLVEVARRCGFVPCGEETVYRGQARPNPARDRIVLREKKPADEYNLFRLYNFATPAGVRLSAGMTFDQWSSSREPSRGRSREYIFESDGQARGWLRTVRRGSGGLLMMLQHPDDETRTASSMLEFGLRRLSRSKSVSCVVPEYQVLLQRLLSQEGFDAIGEYVTLVRSMVAPVSREKARRAVTVAPS